MDTYLNVGEAAKAWKVSPSKVTAWIRAGRIKAVNVGQIGKRPQYRLHVDAIQALLPDTPQRKTRALRGGYDHGL